MGIFLEKYTLRKLRNKLSKPVFIQFGKFAMAEVLMRSNYLRGGIPNRFIYTNQNDKQLLICQKKGFGLFITILTYPEHKNSIALFYNPIISPRTRSHPFYTRSKSSALFVVNRWLDHGCICRKWHVMLYFMLHFY